MSLLQTLLATLVTLGILVTIHEWGHFFVARRCGVKVIRFSIGFGKPIWMRTGKDGTEYAVAAIPLGGYVRMLDEREGNVPVALKSQAFNNKPVYQRMAIVAAGPVVNLVFAVFAYWALFLSGVNVVVPVVGEVAQGSLAQQAGVPDGSELLSVDGHAVRSWDEVNLRLAARVGETGTIRLEAGAPGSEQGQFYTATLNDWNVDLEQESPLQAFGITPYRPHVDAKIGRVEQDGPAQAAGLQAGDLVIALNQQPITGWVDLVDKIRHLPEQSLTLRVQRGDAEQTLTIRSASKIAQDGAVYGYIGAGVEPPKWPADMMRDVQYGPVDALVNGAEKTWQMITLTLDSIGKMIEGAISVKNLSGPITIAKVAGASAASGLESFISFLAYLSISLGVLNLLPIPMLDGGHLLYQIVEVIRGKPVSEQVQMIGLRIGMVLLFSVMALAFINDIARL